ncbi:hypothetical protein O6H91_08G057300 [Diphasiastrum complanatum]|uniref:Uncharacterized protein n=1 Tax=Diphasiastrum complanatum TaxID=34168 RepID=A0ACC2CXU2_DIPCM|nr:hypothetical protein O6H91_08G057300 [Diphasiastrum complanatum]
MPALRRMDSARPAWCAICSKFDFDVNTCRWIGCDVCSHWTHTDCASRVGQIGTAQTRRGNPLPQRLSSDCRACGFTSKLLGWVKDVFKACAADWNKDDLMRELNYVRKIFYGSEEDYGKRLFWKCEELLEKLKNGIDLGAAFKELEHFFQGMKFTMILFTWICPMCLTIDCALLSLL